MMIVGEFTGKTGLNIDLGITVAIGVVAALLYSTTLLPALMVILPVGHKRLQGKSANIKFTYMDRSTCLKINYCMKRLRNY